MRPSQEEPDDFLTLDESVDAALGLSTPTRWAAAVDVYLLLCRSGRVLLLRRANTGFCDGEWSPPCGRLRPFESVVARAVREAREALAVEIAPRAIDFAHVCHHNSDSERLAFFFTAGRWQGEPVNAEPHEHDRLDWFPVDDPPDDLIACAAQGLRHYREGTPFSLLNWPFH